MKSLLRMGIRPDSVRLTGFAYAADSMPVGGREATGRGGSNTDDIRESDCRATCWDGAGLLPSIGRLVGLLDGWIYAHASVYFLSLNTRTRYGFLCNRLDKNGGFRGKTARVEAPLPLFRSSSPVVLKFDSRSDSVSHPQ